MRQQVIERFNRAFGTVARKTAKVLAWDVRPDLGVVVFMDTPSNGHYAKVCVPCPSGATDLPANARRAHSEKRHSNTFASPGLGRGASALYFWVRDESELDQTVRYIGSLPPIRGCA